MTFFFTQHPFLSCLALGLVTGLSQLTVPLLKWAPFLSIPLFFYVFEKITPYKKRLFTAAWSFKFGYYVTSLYWIPSALFIDINHFLWMVPFALFGIPLILGFFFAIPAIIVPWSLLKNRVLFTWGVIIIWIISDLLQTFLFTGFPWAFLSHMWIDISPLAQWFYLVGTYGVTALSLAFFTLPFVVSKKPNTLIYGAFIFMTALSLFLWGVHRLKNKETPSETYWVRLVQPNLAQTIKWEKAHERANLEKMISLSKKPSQHPLQALIWPEAALTYELTPRLASYISQHLSTIPLFITGFIRHGIKEGEQHLWNSIAVLHQKERRLVDYYDKTHLVPFGEYVPLRALMETIVGKGKLKKISHGLLDFSEGPHRKIIHTKELPPVYPLVCYEIIFPLSFEKAATPGWILNLTNDAWFGTTAGPLQHLTLARVRAIETSVPVVRVANTGISAVINAYGEIIASLSLNKEGVLDVSLPIAIK